MDQPPLPQPTPYTCPNCGAGLENLPEFCPRCGQNLQAKPKFARVPLSLTVTIFLALGVLLFGAIGACGGVFVVPIFSPGAANDSEGRGILMAMLIISLPSLAIGLAGFILCLRMLIRGKKR